MDKLRYDPADSLVQGQLEFMKLTARKGHGPFSAGDDLNNA